MSRQPRLISRHQLARWGRTNPQRFAAAAAGSGDPSMLLALDVDDRRVVGRLVSLNVGLPRDIESAGKTVRTAVYKEPVDGPRMVRTINVDGDDQADRAAHGGEHRAVFVYQIDSYRYWEQQLGRHDFTYGQFGENFTVDCLADDEVCIGDRYQIGQAIFEVTQPRVTCFRVGIRMREPRMPSLLVAHHRPGFYLRVLEEGTVQAGDEIARIKAGEEQLSVADIDGLLYLPRRSRRTLERSLRIPALSEGWKGSFKALLDQAGRNPESAPVAWEGFRPLRVTSITRESATITSFRLNGPDAKPLETPSPGQYLKLRLRPDGPDHPPVIRSYSLSSVGAEDGYRISVKLEPDGVGSQFLYQEVREGDIVDVAAPRGSFCLRDRQRPVVFISAGIGATPVLAMLQTLAHAHSSREVWWLHGARNGEEHAFGQEVDHLLGSLPDAHRIVAYSRPLPDDACGQDFDATGRLDIKVIEARHVPIDADCYLCGPDAFVRAMSAMLTARGVPPEQIATEMFGAPPLLAPGVVTGERRAPHQPDGAPGIGPAVTFSRSNLTVAWDQRHSTLLELAEACDVPASFSCRVGVCHYCETGILTGQVNYSPHPLEPPSDGRVLVCCSQPRAEVTLEL